MVGREGSVARCRQLEWQRQGEERMGRKFREMEKEKRGGSLDERWRLEKVEMVMRRIRKRIR